MKKYLSVMIQVIIVIGFIFGVSFPDPVAAEPTAENPVVLTFAYHAPPQASLTKAILEPWANDIEKATEGRVKIIRHPGGTLVKSADSYDAVATGLCDLAQIDPEENPGRFPLTAINSLPFLYPNTEVAGVVAHQLVNKYCAKTELKEIKLMIMAPLHMAQYLGSKKVAVLSDLKGMKIRSSGKIEAHTVNALGGVPIEVGTGDLASALDKGTVDGCFFTFAGALAFGLKDVTKFRTVCNVFPRVFFIGMNKAAFNKLPQDIQRIFEEYSTVQATQRYAAAHAAMEKGAKGAIMGYDKKVGNPPMVVLSDAERNKWKDASKSVWDEWVAETAGKGLPGKAMLDEALSLVETTK
jgi:TRAP-type C4-dicarboxylate transport system substrate-binding protein